MKSRSSMKTRSGLKSVMAPLVPVALLSACLADAAEPTTPVQNTNGGERVAEPSLEHPSHPRFHGADIDQADLVEVGPDLDGEDADAEELDESDIESTPFDGYELFVEAETSAGRQADAWRSVDPDSAALMDVMAAQPIATWIGEWSGNVADTVDDAVTLGGDKLRVFVVYNIPSRDCGYWSSGGASAADSYASFIDEVARGLDGRTAIVVLEPDALALTECLDADQVVERQEMLAAAVDTLTNAGAHVYIDAGDSAWISAADMAARLIAAGIYNAAGFALNVSHTETTSDSIAYADELRAILGDVHYVTDTGRNGIGPDADHSWCNPLGRALGEDPTLSTGVEGLDALLWIKPPGESDGECNGGPAAGVWWSAYALGLAQRA